VVGVLLIGIFWVYMLATSVQNAFFDVIDVTGLPLAIFYVFTALATIVYYRRRVISGAWDFLILGAFPLVAAGFLGWVFVRSMQTASTSSRWSLIGIVALGVVLTFVARVFLRSPFVQIRRESDIEGAVARSNRQQFRRGRPACGRACLRVRPGLRGRTWSGHSLGQGTVSVSAQRKRVWLPRTSRAAGSPAGTRTARIADWSARSAAT
jgi:hypothetical protein